MIPNDVCGTGIADLDRILGGGLPRGRLYLVHGTPGAGKTTLALQFLLAGVRAGETGLYITLSESQEELEDVMQSHGWTITDIAIFELSAVPQFLAPEDQNTVFRPSEVEFSEIMQTILNEVDRRKPTRVVVDSLTEMRLLSETPLRFRQHILGLKQFFASKRSTTLLLDDQGAESGDLAIESIAHGIFKLETLRPSYGTTRRRFSVTKLRGVAFGEGHHDYVIKRGGLVVFPRLIAKEHRREFSREPMPSGMEAFDTMLGGGLRPGTSTLVMGPAGSGKTTLCLSYAAAAAGQGHRVHAYIFDQDRDAILHREGSLGRVIREHVKVGRVRIEQINPAEFSPGELTCRIRDAVENHETRVIILDSLNGYLKAMPDEDYLTLQLHELLTYLAQQGIISLLVLSQSGPVGSVISPVDLSYLADAVVLLRYFEAGGDIRKAISVLKVRTGGHEVGIRELRTGPEGIQIGLPLKQYHGILMGIPERRRRTDDTLE
jgi:circadian clock protein KaiC